MFKETDFTPTVLKNRVWSVSKCRLASNCPYAFNLNYTRKIKLPRGEAAISARVGSAAHSMLEKSLLGDKDYKKIILKAAVDERLTSVEVEDLVALQYNVDRFCEKIKAFKKKYDVVKMLVEQQFFVNTNGQQTLEGWKGKDTLFVLICDLVLYTADHSVLIIDHKTSSSANEQHVFEQYGDQVRAYSALAPIIFPEAKRIQTAFNYIQPEEVIWGDMVSRKDVVERHIPWFINFVNSSAENSKAEIATPGQHCNFCQYRAKHCTACL